MARDCAQKAQGSLKTGLLRRSMRTRFQAALLLSCRQKMRSFCNERESTKEKIEEKYPTACATGWGVLCIFISYLSSW
ncbi:hypothetical protein GCWU000324_02345 [Kingella oralis ATCC 51147]|uniref:Uncharacterized protein n=1 Tax=Kingella oralis ATCC 51147 TaxID=629741 RepID=C4GJX1_9NEIS|nr:hypothetical protein GCWU000324_02345 [Kingella oralis ATCC 51147]